jgi:hypothetical protein
LARFLIKHADGRIEGPITVQQLRDWVRAGKVIRSTLIQVEGQLSWHAAGTVPGLAQLFAEAEAAAAQSVPDEVPPAEPNDLNDATGSAETSAATPAGAIAAAAVPARRGLGDRILRGAFHFARSISVLVIIVSLLVTAAGSAVAVYALLPSPRLPPEPVDKPTLAEFVEECSRASQSERASRRLSSQEHEFAPVDDCGPYRERSEAVAARLRLSASAVDVLCSRIEAIRPKDRDAFISGLESLAAEFEKNPPKGEGCTAASGANWYMNEFAARIAREQAEEARAAAAVAARRNLLMPAMTAIGAAIASLLSFLILPLLIQIERNTRTVD